MIEELGRIIAIDNSTGDMTVEFAVKTSCSGCQSQSNCGTGAVARAFSSKSQIVQLPKLESAEVGDSVRVGMPESSMLGASLLVYMLPLAAFLSAALIGQATLAYLGIQHEIWTMAFAAASTAVCLRWSRYSKTVQRYSQISPTVLGLQPRTKIKVQAID